METTYTKQEKIIFSLTVLFAAAFTVFFFTFKQNSSVSSQSETSGINYEMAKLKSKSNTYSLDGREIERTAEELQAEIIAEAAKAKETAQKKEEAKNKEKAKVQTAKTTKAQDKAKAEQAKKAKEAAQKQAQAQQALENKKAELAKNQNDQNYYANGSVPPVAQEEVVEQPKFKSIAQWKAELMATPSKELVVKFVNAYRAKEIKEVEFYQLTNEMIQSTNSNITGLGLYALRLTPSYASFKQLVLVQPTVIETYQQYIQTTLMSYHQESTLFIFKTALTAQDKTVVLKALEVLKTGVIDIKAGSVASIIDPRYQREVNAAQFSLASYYSFLPTLENLEAKSSLAGDRDIALAAQQTISEIGPVTSVAANP